VLFQQAFKGLLDSLAHRDLLAQLVQLDSKVPLDRKVTLVNQASSETQVTRDNQDHRVLLVHRVLLAQLVTVVPLDQLEPLVLQDCKAQLDPTVLKASLVLLVQQEVLDQLGLLGEQDLQVPPESVVSLEPRDRLAFRDHPGLKALKDLQEAQVFTQHCRLASF
jgi:hypothetical protein